VRHRVQAALASLATVLLVTGVVPAATAHAEGVHYVDAIGDDRGEVTFQRVVDELAACDFKSDGVRAGASLTVGGSTYEIEDVNGSELPRSRRRLILPSGVSATLSVKHNGLRYFSTPIAT